MIINPDPKKRRTGGVEYLVKGRKKDRKLKRNEIDERDIYFGDYEEFEAATDYLEEKQIKEGTDYSNYHHFTISYLAEDLEKLTREQKIAIANETIRFQYAGFLDEELIKIGEQHIPKIKSENSINERYEHTHLMVSNLNRVTGKKVTPRVHSLFADKLFQTYICRKYGLSIPLLDNKRGKKVFRNEIISRYKNDTFQLKKENKSQLRKTFANDLKYIESKEDFLRYFQENGINIELSKDKKKYFVTLSDGEKFNIRGKGFEHVENVLFNKSLEVYDDGIFKMDLPTLESKVNELIENRTVEFEKRLRTQREKARVNSLSNQNNLESGEKPNVKFKQKNFDTKTRSNEFLYEYVDRELGSREFAEDTDNLRTLSVRDMAELSERTEMLLQSNKGLYVRYEDGRESDNIVRRAKESDGGTYQKSGRSKIIDENDLDLESLDKELLIGEVNQPNNIHKKDSLSFLSSRPQITKTSELEQNISLIDDERKEESLKDLTAFIKDNLRAKEVYEYAAKKYNLFPAKYEVLEDENKINCLDYKKPKKYNVVDFYTKELNLPFKEAIYELKSIHNIKNLDEKSILKDIANNELSLNKMEVIVDEKKSKALKKELEFNVKAAVIERAVDEKINNQEITKDTNLTKKQRKIVEEYKIEILSSKEIKLQEKELNNTMLKLAEIGQKLKALTQEINYTVDERVEKIEAAKKVELENKSKKVTFKDYMNFMSIQEATQMIKKVAKVEYGNLKYERNPILKFVNTVKNTVSKSVEALQNEIINRRYRELQRKIENEREIAERRDRQQKEAFEKQKEQQQAKPKEPSKGGFKRGGRL